MRRERVMDSLRTVETAERKNTDKRVEKYKMKSR